MSGKRILEEWVRSTRSILSQEEENALFGAVCDELTSQKELKQFSNEIRTAQTALQLVEDCRFAALRFRREQDKQRHPNALGVDRLVKVATVDIARGIVCRTLPLLNRRKGWDPQFWVLDLLPFCNLTPMKHQNHGDADQPKPCKASYLKNPFSLNKGEAHEETLSALRLFMIEKLTKSKSGFEWHGIREAIAYVQQLLYRFNVKHQPRHNPPTRPDDVSIPDRISPNDPVLSGPSTVLGFHQMCAALKHAPTKRRDSEDNVKAYIAWWALVNGPFHDQTGCKVREVVNGCSVAELEKKLLQMEHHKSIPDCLSASELAKCLKVWCNGSPDCIRQRVSRLARDTSCIYQWRLYRASLMPDSCVVLFTVSVLALESTGNKKESPKIHEALGSLLEPVDRLRERFEKFVPIRKGSSDIAMLTSEARTLVERLRTLQDPSGVLAEWYREVSDFIERVPGAHPFSETVDEFWILPPRQMTTK